MGSAQSARGIQLGEKGTAARCGGISSRDPPPGAAGPRRAHFLRRRCAATGSGSAWKGSGRRWQAAPAARFTAPPARTSPLPGAAGFSALCALSARSRLPPLAVRLGWRRGGRGHRRGRGPPLPARLPDRGGLSSVRPDRVASPRAGTGPRSPAGARGLRRCRQPTRPVLKHGPRSLTRARVRGSPRFRNPVAQ